jgi:hypothetical protein
LVGWLAGCLVAGWVSGKVCGWPVRLHDNRRTHASSGHAALTDTRHICTLVHTQRETHTHTHTHTHGHVSTHTRTHPLGCAHSASISALLTPTSFRAPHPTFATPQDTIDALLAAVDNVEAIHNMSVQYYQNDLQNATNPQVRKSSLSHPPDVRAYSDADTQADRRMQTRMQHTPFMSAHVHAHTHPLREWSVRMPLIQPQPTYHRLVDLFASSYLRLRRLDLAATSSLSRSHSRSFTHVMSYGSARTQVPQMLTVTYYNEGGNYEPGEHFAEFDDSVT